MAPATTSTRPLHGEALLLAAERSRSSPHLLRPLVLLAEAGAWNVREAADLPLRQVQAELLHVWRQSFGDALPSFATCMACGAEMEFSMSASSLLEDAEHEALADSREGARPVTTADLMACERLGDRVHVQTALLQRTGCLEPGAALPTPDAQRRFEAVNAGAALQAVVGCVECGMQATLEIDIAEHLGREVRASAGRLLGEVHRLASVYGWSEASILAMPATRRSQYLEMLGT